MAPPTSGAGVVADSEDSCLKDVFFPQQETFDQALKSQLPRMLRHPWRYHSSFNSTQNFALFPISGSTILVQLSKAGETRNEGLHFPVKVQVVGSQSSSIKQLIDINSIRSRIRQLIDVEERGNGIYNEGFVCRILFSTVEQMFEDLCSKKIDGIELRKGFIILMETLADQSIAILKAAQDPNVYAGFISELKRKVKQQTRMVRSEIEDRIYKQERKMALITLIVTSILAVTVPLLIFVGNILARKFWKLD